MHNEQVYTPRNIVELMLNNVGYISSEDILDKHIIDNSCGKGAFLSEIVDRYIKACILNAIPEERIIKGLETFIHGIEIDDKLCRETTINLDNIATSHGITNIKWDINNNDAVDCMDEYRQAMDFVVGNPPYCKVHDLTIEKREKYKNACGTSKGTFDSYVMFFWIGISMMNQNGKLVYITPSSWTTSLYARELREWLCDNKGIMSIIDMKHQKIFNEATTFTMITGIGNIGNNNTTAVYEYSDNGDIIKLNDIPLTEYMDSDKGIFYFKGNNVLSKIKSVNNVFNISDKERMFEVKNGFATLNDKLFIHDVKDMQLTDDNVLLCMKASKDIMKTIIYPYDKDGKPLRFDELSEYVQEILLKRAKELNMDTIGYEWYLYGRNQAIKDVFKSKIAINNLIKDVNDVKLSYIKGGVGVYSGFYILSKDDFDKKDTIDFVSDTLRTNDFVDYVHSLGRYKNGGFSTFTACELRNYLNYEWKKYNQ